MSFLALKSTYISDLIGEVRIRVKKNNGRMVIFNKLSEGEQQLLTVLGLLKFNKNQASYIRYLHIMAIFI